MTDTRTAPTPAHAAVSESTYARLGRVVFGGRTAEESRRRLFQGVEDLLERLEMPRTCVTPGCPSTRSSPRSRTWP